jgi:hypothetical protein
MRNFIKQLLRENLTPLIITEIYGRNVIDSIAKRFSDTSEDMKNKLAIASLFRNIFGDIFQYKDKQSFDIKYNDWYNKTLDSLIKTREFYENKDNAKKYLDAYIKNIKSLGNKAVAFSLKKIETGLIDLVNNNKWIETDSTSISADIYKPHDKDILFEDDNIIILNTDTKAKCIMYGRGESWCITKPELNYYNTYRLSYGATPYFVLQKNVEGDEHKLVIMNYGNGDYAIADRSNTGSRAGGKESTMLWGDIESEILNLKGKEKYFKYREITDDEKKYDDLVNRTRGYDGNNLFGFINHNIKNLVVNDSKVTASDFIRDYAATGVNISDEQLKSLDESCLNSLIEVGFFIRNRFKYYNENIFKILNKKQILRNIRIKMNNNIKLNDIEIEYLPIDEQNEYNQNLIENFIDKFNLTPEKFYGKEEIDDNLFLTNLTSIPKGFNPKINGFLDLSSVVTIPKGFSPIVNGNLFLDSLEIIPQGFNPQVKGRLNLNSVKSIPQGFNPKVTGTLNLKSLIEVPEGFNPEVGGSLALDSVKSIPKNFRPKVGRVLDLISIESIPEGFSPIVGVDLDLANLKSIPMDFNPIVRGDLFLDSLTSNDIPKGLTFDKVEGNVVLKNANILSR